jgi:hypothetical protein
VAGRQPDRLHRRDPAVRDDTLRDGQSWRNYEIRVAAVVEGREETISKVIDLAAGDTVELTLDPQQRTASTDATVSIR